MCSNTRTSFQPNITLLQRPQVQRKTSNQTLACLHPATVQNTRSSLTAEPTAHRTAADQQPVTQPASVRTPPYTINLEHELLKSEGVIPAAAEEEKWMISPLETAVVYDVDAEIIADAIIGVAMRSRAHPVKNASAVVKSDATIDADLAVAVHNRYIVVVSSSRMWDPGGCSRANHRADRT